MSQLPLSGIRVLDLGRFFAAPWAAQLLGDLGADVIKVERLMGDEMRHYGPPFLQALDGSEILESTYSLSCNRSKRGIAVDITKPEGAQIVRDLALQCDVVIENFKVGDLARRGLDEATLKALKPDLIYCSITGFGQNGPYKNRAALDPMAQAMSGLMSVTGEPDGDPQKIGVVMVDLITGLYSVIAVLAALRHKEVNKGPGQSIDMALLDTAVATMSHRAMEYLVTGAVPQRKGTRSAGNVPAGMFACADGVVCVQAGGDPQFAKLCRALDRPDLLEDPRFNSRRGRVENEDLLMGLLGEIFAPLKTAEAFDLLLAERVFCAPLYDVADCFADPQVQSRGLRQSIPHAKAGEVATIANPIRYSATPLSLDRAPPMLGEHTDEVLSQILGLDETTLERLHAQRVIG